MIQVNPQFSNNMRGYGFVGGLQIGGIMLFERACPKIKIQPPSVPMPSVPMPSIDKQSASDISVAKPSVSVPQPSFDIKVADACKES